MSKLDLEPHQVIVDCVLQYSPTMPKLHQAAFMNGNLIFATNNHRGRYVSYAIPVHLDGGPFDGDEHTPPRFVLYRIHPGVWKVTPSILDEALHAYLTIVGVPEDVW